MQKFILYIYLNANFRRIAISLFITCIAFLLILTTGEILQFIGFDKNPVELVIYYRNWFVQNVTPLDLEALRNSGYADIADIIFWTIFVSVIVWANSRSNWMNSLDLHLISPFDSAKFIALPSHTGILKWSGPQENQHQVWDRLQGWLDKGSDYQWRKFKPTVENPFTWASLSGPNGLGKTQISLEFGKSISTARQPQLGVNGCDSRWKLVKARLANWWKRSPRQPWDVGCLSGGGDRLLETLESWLPRRPTLLILDDPLPTKTKKLITTLVARQEKFHYPVRLLLVDQFVPLFEEDVLNRSLTESINLPTVEFTREVCGTALRINTLSGKAESDESVRELWASDNRDRFHRETHGWPLIVALGALWLSRPGRSVTQLINQSFLDEEESETQAFRDASLGPAAHHLIRERARELINTALPHDYPHRETVFKALACSTLAGGIPLESIRRTYLNLPGNSELKRLFPHHDLNSGFPIIRPAFVAEVFLTEILTSEYGDPSSQKENLISGLAKVAWQLHPAGMVRTLFRAPWKNQGLIQAIQVTVEQHNFEIEELISVLEEAINDAVLRSGRLAPTLVLVKKLENFSATDPNTIAHLKKLCDHIERIWNDDHADTPRAVVVLAAVAVYLPDHELPAAVQQFEKLLSQWRRGYPFESNHQAHTEENSESGLARKTLEICFSRLGPHLLRHVKNLTDVFYIQEHIWQRLCWIFIPWGNFNFGKFTEEGDAAGFLFKRAARLYGNLSGPAELPEWLEPNKPETNLVTAWLLSSNQLPFIDQTAFEALLVHQEYTSLWSDLFHVRYLRQAWFSVVNQSCTTEKIQSICARYPKDVLFQRELVAALRQRVVSAAALSKSQPNIDKALVWLPLIEDLAAQAFTDDLVIQSDRAGAWLTHAFDLADTRQVIETRAVAERVEAITQAQEVFKLDLQLQLMRAEVWRNLAFALSHAADVAETRVVAERVEAITQAQVAFKLDIGMQHARADAWRCLTSALYQAADVAETRVIAERVEAITQARDAFKLDLQMQRVRAMAWRYLALARSNAADVAETRVIAERVEAITQAQDAFKLDLQMQSIRAEVWRHLTFALSNAADVAETRVIAERVEAITQAQDVFKLDLQMQRMRAEAWRNLSFVLSNAADVTEIRVVAERVETITQAQDAFKLDLQMQRERAEVWRHLTFALSNAADVAETRVVAERVEAITQAQDTFKLELLMQRERAGAWTFLSCAYSAVGQWDQATRLIEIVQHIAVQFSDNDDIQRLARHARQVHWQLHAKQAASDVLKSKN